MKVFVQSTIITSITSFCPLKGQATSRLVHGASGRVYGDDLRREIWTSIRPIWAYLGRPTTRVRTRSHPPKCEVFDRLRYFSLGKKDRSTINLELVVRRQIWTEMRTPLDYMGGFTVLVQSDGHTVT